VGGEPGPSDRQMAHLLGRLILLAAPIVPFVGATAVLKPEHATLGAALILAALKKKPRCYKLFFV